jgi:hypothetical protein
MGLVDGTVTELELAPPGAVAEEKLEGIVDPLSAMLVPAPGADAGSWQEACRRTLPVFDGRHRYDLRLAFKRMDVLSEGQGYRGPLLVCALTYVATADHSGATTLMKYLSEGREMEVALAPVPGTPVLAPVRLFVAGMLGNLIVTATRFETGLPAAPQ